MTRGLSHRCNLLYMGMPGSSNYTGLSSATDEPRGTCGLAWERREVDGAGPRELAAEWCRCGRRGAGIHVRGVVDPVSLERVGGAAERAPRTRVGAWTDES